MKKELKLFILPNCPYCLEVLGWIKELKAENPQYSAIDITLIDEKVKSELAAQYDYYYVPTFFLENVKLHEGGATKEKVNAIFKRCLSD